MTAEQMPRGPAQMSREHSQGNLTPKAPTAGQVCADLPLREALEGQTGCFCLSLSCRAGLRRPSWVGRPLSEQKESVPRGDGDKAWPAAVAFGSYPSTGIQSTKNSRMGWAGTGLSGRGLSMCEAQSQYCKTKIKTQPHKI